MDTIGLGRTFYNRILFKKFQEGVDYQEITHEEYKVFDRSNLSDQKLHAKANRAKVYKVTGRWLPNLDLFKYQIWIFFKHQLWISLSIKSGFSLSTKSGFL